MSSYNLPPFKQNCVAMEQRNCANQYCMRAAFRIISCSFEAGKTIIPVQYFYGLLYYIIVCSGDRKAGEKRAYTSESLGRENLDGLIPVCRKLSRARLCGNKLDLEALQI